MKSDTAPNLNHCWARLVVEELLRRGVAGFCLSPGSRNTPLVQAVAEHADANYTMHFDERGAAFHALGWAKASGVPVALICTSGTATANYLPAVVEAAQSQVPLIVLTADRPPELIACGANQAIIQPGIYGDYVRYAECLPCPSVDFPPGEVLTTVNYAYDAATGITPGPVHLNCRYREPLAATPDGTDLNAYLEPLHDWMGCSTPYRDAPAMPEASEAVLAELLELIGDAEQGLLIIGRLDSGEESAAVQRFAERLGWPVFADITSGLRLVGDALPFQPYYDHCLLSERFRKGCQPDTVLQIGGAFTSKRLLHHLDSLCPRYALLNGSTRCQDPNHQLTDRFTSPIGTTCDRLTELLATQEAACWLPGMAYTAELHALIDAWLDKQTVCSEIAVARSVSRLAPPGSMLFLGNSMPVRDMDMYGVSNGHVQRVVANRGASGIDGTIATAAGLACHAAAPVAAVVGDLACLHDLNSLALLRDCAVPVVLVIINNDGGGIFHFLPVADTAASFEACFATPHGLDFQHAAAQFGLPYIPVTTREAFESAYTDALARPGATVVEVTTDRTDNRALHAELQCLLADALEHTFSLEHQ